MYMEKVKSDKCYLSLKCILVNSACGSYYSNVLGNN